MADYVRDYSLVEDLPAEITLMIFKQLDISTLYNVSHACTRWKELAKHRSLWTTPYVGSSLKDPKHVLNIFKSFGCMELVEKLSLHCAMTQPVDGLLEEIRLHCRGLRKLSLFGQTLSDLFVIGSLILFCPMLEELVLIDSRSLSLGTYLCLTQDEHRCIRKLAIVDCGWHLTIYVLDLFRWMKNLQYLYVEVIPHHVDKVVRLLSVHAISLRLLRLRGILSTELLAKICTCVGLEHLYVNICYAMLTSKNVPSCIPNPPPVADPMLPRSADWIIHEMAFPLLKYLRLKGILALPDQALAKMANHCSQLQECYLMHCRKITISSIERILAICTNLKRLELMMMKGIDISALDVFLLDNHTTWHILEHVENKIRIHRT